ncbi:hypothetical protein BDV96DRAFT_610686 [Lophiotrema nucula]|uniref:Sds3-like-domain-containing protein n=1 Tax=Lophiotrema nucula TaxID=690887 RepID=A0A6A5ZIN5_9PLEO|nr:hypothetical protein BDV96DRAFT_610686 [Lophiotrema nucula]
MPPKRKHKATKASAAPAQPSPRQSGSSRIRRRSSVSQGARTSRLQPSEPLHMTTRRASKAVSNNTSPAAPSLADADSRRNSLNSIANIDDHSDLEDERPAKRRRSRTSAVSGSPDDSMGSFVSQIPVTEAQSAKTAKPNARVAQTRKRRASGDSSESSKTLSAAQNGVPARSESDDVPEKQQPRRKKRKTAATAAATPPPEVAEPPPELTYDSTPAGSPDQPPELDLGDDVQNVLPSTADGAPAKAAKRLPGRRRQPHPDITVETELRRQLHLKMGYRSTTKALKNLLDELSNRTINNLENDPNYHKRFPAYQHVMNQLDERRQQRIDSVNADRRLHLEQLERLRVAQEHIEHEQYINRFKDLQNDALLQCFYRMKQMQREMKRVNGEATDDEENIVEPTHMEFPALNDDDRLGSKYASRSRAYVETERLLEEDEHRDKFSHVLKSFIDRDDDFETGSVQEVPDGFATFTGPDRTEGVAHRGLMSLLDASTAVEQESFLPKESPVVRSEQADALFLLASISADQPPATSEQQKQPYYAAPSQTATPVHQTELQRQVSPFPLTTNSSDAVAADTAKESSLRPAVELTPKQNVNGLLIEHPTEMPKQVTPARTSHRISDILNNDQDSVPAPAEARTRTHERTPSMTPSRRQSISQQPTPSRADPLRLESIMHNQDQPLIHKRSVPEETVPSTVKSPTQSTPYWPDRSSTADEPKKNPLVRIREMIERANAEKVEHQRLAAEAVPERPSQQQQGHRQESQGSHRSSYTQSPSMSRSYLPGPSPRLSSNLAPGPSPNITPALLQGQSPNMPYAQSYAPSPNMPPAHSYAPSPNMAPAQSYTPSPNMAQAQSHGPPAPPAPPAPQEPPRRESLNPPRNQPAATPTAPAKPTNFRFAHYDPAPVNRPYPPPPPGWKPPNASAPPSVPTPAPPPQHYPNPYNGPPPPPGYGYPSYPPQPPQGYTVVAHQPGFVPPPGSFQAPPPPPLKVQQYGGTPILPASMAPGAPAPASQGPSTFAQGYVGVPVNEHGQPVYDMPSPPRRNRPPTPQPRPRRQYRSYHAPGTQFRTYQGPDVKRKPNGNGSEKGGMDGA